MSKRRAYSTYKDKLPSFWEILAVIVFFILYCIVGTMEYNSQQETARVEQHNRF
jgi:hypothetical protein